jgi:hypothetical protein
MRLTLLACFVWQSAALEFEADVGPEDLVLLQMRAEKHSHNRTGNGVSPNSAGAFGSCADFGGTADIIGRGNFKPHNSNYDFCRCWGDTHCDHVPFEYRTKHGEVSKVRVGHYQYDGPGASTFAKAADGSWEVQIFQCGFRPNFHPSSIRGVAIKVGDDVVQWANANGKGACYVNGEKKEFGHEVHLDSGFHFRCPDGNKGDFCAVNDGQFAAMTGFLSVGTNQVLAVPKGVEVQQANTVCYDAASKENSQIRFGKEISNTAIVPVEAVLFTEPVLEFLSSHKGWDKCYLPDPPQSQPPLGNSIDIEGLCKERGGKELWKKAKLACSRLAKKPHWPLHDDCLLDECGGADEDEETFIEEIAEEDTEEKNENDEAGAVGDPHLLTPGLTDNQDLCCEGGHCSPCQ